MGLVIAALVLFAFALVWTLLPLMPGLREIWQKTDISPLQVAADSSVDVRHFAEGFKRVVSAELTAIMQESATSGETRQGMLANGWEYLVVPGGGDEPVAIVPPEHLKGTDRRVIASDRSLLMSGDAVRLGSIYSAESIRGGSRCAYHALLAEDSIDLGRESVVLRWLHAGRSLMPQSLRRTLVGLCAALGLLTGCSDTWPFSLVIGAPDSTAERIEDTPVSEPVRAMGPVISKVQTLLAGLG